MEYTTETNSKGGFRFDIKNPPASGTEIMTTDGEAVIFDEVSIAGMLACTRKRDGSQQLYFPQQLVTPNALGQRGAAGGRSA